MYAAGHDLVENLRRRFAPLVSADDEPHLPSFHANEHLTSRASRPPVTVIRS
jgi:hypothetical protein